MRRRWSPGRLAIAAVVLWLAVDRPWTVRPIAAPETSGAFDAARYVDAIWSSRVVPGIETAAVSPARLRESGGTGAHAVRFDGVVLSVDTSSRVGVAIVDEQPVDGLADLMLQIGPVPRGTALRDTLPFVQFSDFANQIQFAAVATALNERALADAIGAIAAVALDGRRVRGIGAASIGGAPDVLPLVLPVRLHVEDAP